MTAAKPLHQPEMMRFVEEEMFEREIVVELFEKEIVEELLEILYDC